MCFIFWGCSSVKSLKDYDDLTYEKKDYSEKEVLGSIKVSSLGFVWTKYNPKDNKTLKLMQRLEQNALRKCGTNIDIIAVDIGSMNESGTTALWVAGGVIGSSAAMVAYSSFSKRVTKNRNEDTEITNEAGYSACMGTIAASFTVFLFKGITASGIVIRADKPYTFGTYMFVSDDEIEAGHDKYLRDRNKLEAVKQERLLQNNREQLNNLRNQLIVRRKDAKSPIVILNKGITDIRTTDGVNCYVRFINISDKIAKYVKIDLTPYNRVLDQAYSHIDGTSNKTVTVTNFIGPNEEYYSCTNIWYNSTIFLMEIIKVEMIFTDNTNLVIDNAELLKNIEFSANEYSQYLDFMSPNATLIK